jgi:hypothetical protein
MKKIRVAMEVIRTLAAVIAATALLMHTPRASAQSALSGPWSFTPETIESLSMIHYATWYAACHYMT